MDKFDEYRHLMAECLEMAEIADCEEQKLAFLEIARLWCRLAERQAKHDVAARSERDAGRGWLGADDSSM